MTSYICHLVTSNVYPWFNSRQSWSTIFTSEVFVPNKDTHLQLKQMRLSTAVKALINKCECLGDLNSKLRKGCRLFLIAMIEKSTIVRYSSCLAPYN